jgi:hypothetical protein
MKGPSRHSTGAGCLCRLRWWESRQTNPLPSLARPQREGRGARGGEEEGRVGPCVLHLALGQMHTLIMPQNRIPVYGVFPYLLPKKHPISD